MAGSDVTSLEERISAERAMARRLRTRGRRPLVPILALSLTASAVVTTAWMLVGRSMPGRSENAATSDVAAPAAIERVAGLEAQGSPARPATPTEAAPAKDGARAEQVVVEAEPRSAPAQGAPAAEVRPADPLPVSAAAKPPEPSPAPAARAVEPPTRAEVATFMNRAREHIRSGNIAAARALLDRAAEGDDSDALFALAETYDPAVLARWGARGIRADVEAARRLYGRASDKGLRTARERLLAMRQ